MAPLRHLTSINDLSNGEIEQAFSLAGRYLKRLGDPDRAYRVARGIDIGRGVLLATLFYEPSTRTRLSFESAMLRLGGKTISSADPNASSAAKGESLADSVRMLSNYADAIVVRHKRDGAARLAAEYAHITSVIKADDEGFFSVRIDLPEPIATNSEWVEYSVDLLEPVRPGVDRTRATGEIFVPASTARFGVISDLDDTVMVCRCEGISAGDLRASLGADFGQTEVNRLKAVTRCGMGRCQGRFCGLAAAELTAHALDVPLETVGRLRAQAPIKPIPLAVSPVRSAPAATRDETSAPV